MQNIHDILILLAALVESLLYIQINKFMGEYILGNARILRNSITSAPPLGPEDKWDEWNKSQAFTITKPIPDPRFESLEIQIRSSSDSKLNL